MTITGQSDDTRVLTSRPFQLLAVAFTLSRAGSILYTVALTVTILEQTGSAGWISASIAVRLLPPVVLGPFAGVIADRYGRKRVAVIADVMRALLLLITALCVVAESPVIVLVVLGGAVSLAGLPLLPAVAGLLPDVVAEPALPRANSVIASVEYIALIVGPALGAVLLIVGTPAGPFAVTAATFALAALAMSRLRTPTTARAASTPRARDTSDTSAEDDAFDTTDPPATLWRDLHDGVRLAAREPATRVLFVVICALTFVFGVEQVAAPFISRDLLGTGEAGVGWLDAAVGVGGVLGAVVAGRIARSTRPRGSLALVVVGSTMPMALLAFVSEPWVAYAILLVEGAAAVSLDVMAISTVQRVAPRDAISRVDSLITSGALLAVLIGNLAAPFLLTLLGLQTTLVAVATIPTVLVLLYLVTARSLDGALAAESEETADVRVALAASPLIDGLPSSGLDRLARSAQWITARDGTVVLRQGEPADALYLLAAGRVQVLDESAGTPIATLSAPDVFGELGVVRRKPRNATVISDGDISAWRIEADEFLAAMDRLPSLPSSLTAVMERRLNS